MKSYEVCMPTLQSLAYMTITNLMSAFYPVHAQIFWQREYEWAHLIEKENHDKISTLDIII